MGVNLKFGVNPRKKIFQQNLSKIFRSQSSEPSKKLLLFNGTVFGITVFRGLLFFKLILDDAIKIC